MERYRYIRPLGQGASGQSYIAEDLQTHDTVVIKRFFRDQTLSSERELAMLRDISHPQIPRYIDSYYKEIQMIRQLHLVTSYVPAENICEQAVDPWELAKQGLSVLNYLHTLSPPILHRDIKPSNLLWSEDKNLILIDFGSAVRGEPGSFGRTIMTGTIGYQAPEQILGEPQLNSDIYSLAAVVVEKIAGIRAFSMLDGQRLNWEDKIQVSPIVLLWLRKALDPNHKERRKITVNNDA